MTLFNLPAQVEIHNRLCTDDYWQPIYAIFALIIAHALMNAHPLVWTSKMVIFLIIFGNSTASNKRPLQYIEKTILSYALIFRICCLIPKHAGPFLSGSPMKWMSYSTKCLLDQMSLDEMV